MDSDRILIMYHYSPIQNTFYSDEMKQIYINTGSVFHRYPTGQEKSQ